MKLSNALSGLLGLGLVAAVAIAALAQATKPVPVAASPATDKVQPSDDPRMAGFKGKIAKKYEDSREDWPKRPQAPAGAPNVLIILLDDVGFGQIGAYGRGVLYENGVFTGYCDLVQGSIGFQLGGQAYSEIICFSTTEALTLFKTGNFAFDAQATAVALKSGAGANAKYSNGVAVFTMDESGLMFEASIGGQKFSYEAK